MTPLEALAARALGPGATVAVKGGVARASTTDSRHVEVSAEDDELARDALAGALATMVARKASRRRQRNRALVQEMIEKITKRAREAMH